MERTRHTVYHRRRANRDAGGRTYRSWGEPPASVYGSPGRHDLTPPKGRRELPTACGNAMVVPMDWRGVFARMISAKGEATEDAGW